MSHATISAQPVRSARPELTAELMAQTDLDEARRTELVHRFYGRVRADDVLGPIFAARVRDWEPHLERMVAFWTSVTLMTGQYHGRPVSKHAGLPVTWEHYERWLAIFRETARETCPLEGAAHVIERAERIAQSLFMASQDAARDRETAPVLR